MRSPAIWDNPGSRGRNRCHDDDAPPRPSRLLDAVCIGRRGDADPAPICLGGGPERAGRRNQPGKIRGTVANGITGFKGVPYGASTAGANRFMPPASRHPGAACARRSTGPDMRRRPSPASAGPRCRLCPASPGQGPGQRGLPDANVWTPGLDAGKRPVMVWFHGGALLLRIGQYAAHRRAPTWPGAAMSSS